MSKVKSGQSQLLIPLIIILTSALVFATNTYINATNNSTPTGEFLVAQQAKETSFSIEVWANTTLMLESQEGTIRTILTLDNGTLLENQQINLFLNDSLLYSGTTNAEGTVEIPFNESGKIRSFFSGNSSLFLNPSEAEIEIVVEKEGIKNWISYDPESDTIRVVGDDEHCTFSKPCTLTDIKNADQENGWNKIQNLDNYYQFNSRLKIGDGKNKTWVLSSLEHIYILEPWEVSTNANLQLGISDKDGVQGGSFFETNVSEKEQLEKESAIKVDEGGSLSFYDSVYKVYGSANNNIYLDENAIFNAKRFDIENVYRYPSEKTDSASSKNPKTSIYLPKNAVLVDFIERDNIAVVCANKNDCKNEEGRKT